MQHNLRREMYFSRGGMDYWSLQENHWKMLIATSNSLRETRLQSSLHPEGKHYSVRCTQTVLAVPPLARACPHPCLHSAEAQNIPTPLLSMKHWKCSVIGWLQGTKACGHNTSEIPGLPFPGKNPSQHQRIALSCAHPHIVFQPYGSHGLQQTLRLSSL